MGNTEGFAEAHRKLRRKENAYQKIFNFFEPIQPLHAGYKKKKGF
jgi:hypothetical protein